MEKNETPLKVKKRKNARDLDKFYLIDLMERDTVLHKNGGKQVFPKVPAIPLEVAMICIKLLIS